MFVCLFSMITLKVLNSIVLLGKSCMYVKEANMEEKLFQNPPSAAPSRVSSRADRTKHTREPPGNTHAHLLTHIIERSLIIVCRVKVLFSLIHCVHTPLKVSQRRRACLHQSPLNPPKGMSVPPLRSPPANQISSSLHQMNQKRKALIRTIPNLHTGRPKKTCWRLTALLSAVTVSTDINAHPQV